MTDARQDDARDAAAVPPPAERGNPGARRRWLTILAAIVVFAIALYAVWRLFIATPSESTDDAYVAGDTVTITARDPGTVTALYADDTERVRAGQPLVDLDPATADVELEAAAAQLGQAVRGVRADFSAVNAAQAEVTNARADLARARNDLGRRQQAAQQGAVSGEEVSHAADTVKTATAALDLAQSKLAQLYIHGIGTKSDPVEAAKWFVLARRAGLNDPSLEDFYLGLNDQQQKAAVDAANKYRSGS